MKDKGLEVMARMTDSKLQVRDVIDSFILLTYDLPHTPEGDKARVAFLAEASAIGATRHTDSVYLLPYSPEASALALKLAETEGGEVIVWGNATPLNKKDEITAAYDANLRKMIRELSGRLDRMDKYRFSNHQKRVIQMVPKTERVLSGLEGAAERRGDAAITLWVGLLRQRFAQIMR